MKICLLADDFTAPFDEGFKKISSRLAGEFSAEHELLVLAGRGSSSSFPVELHRANRLLLSPGLRSRLRRFAPDIMVYIPFSSFTRNSFFRCKVLRSYVPGCRIGMIGVQARAWRSWERPLLRLFSPDVVFTPLPEAIETLDRLGVRTRFLPFGAALDKFTPAAAGTRDELRRRYGLQSEGRVFLHVGQITEKRNVRILSQLQGDDRQVVVVGSSSSATQGFPHDSGVIRFLEEAGVKVYVKYFPNIEELYQLADCYLFPVFHETGGLGFPLSVVEALACGTRVVSTRFGGLEKELPDCDVVRYADSDEEFIEAAMNSGAGPDRRARDLVGHLSWGGLADRVVKELLA